MRQRFSMRPSYARFTPECDQITASVRNMKLAEEY